MGSGPADHELAAAGTGGSEPRHAIEDAVELCERLFREAETNPSMDVHAKMVREDVLVMEAGLPPPSAVPKSQNVFTSYYVFTT